MNGWFPKDGADDCGDSDDDGTDNNDDNGVGFDDGNNNGDDDDDGVGFNYGGASCGGGDCVYDADYIDHDNNDN